MQVYSIISTNAIWTYTLLSVKMLYERTLFYQ